MKKLFIVLSLIAVQQAFAYPQFIAKGYTTCASCHYSPTGGGFPNSYGHSTLSATFPDTFGSDFLESMRKKAEKHDVTGYDSKKEPAFQWDLGLDLRLLFLTAPQGDEGESEGTGVEVIPMLFEIGGVTAYGPWLLYGTVTPRRSGPGQVPDSVFSREHWVQYRINDESSIRLGRMVLPFGLRIPDHTQYTREDLHLSQWNQSYGAEWDLYNQNWSISAGAFGGDLILEPTELQQRGGVVSVARNFSDRASLGVSALLSISEMTGRTAGSLFARYRIWKKVYTMGELTPFREWGRKVDGSRSETAGLFRLGWFPIESLDTYFEWGGRGVFHEYDLTKLRYMWGVNWQILPWIELAPALLLEENVETGMHVSGLFQFHAIF
jgi:hypothetical protein